MGKYQCLTTFSASSVIAAVRCVISKFLSK